MTNFLVKIWNTIQAYGFWGKIRLVKLDDPILGQVADPVHFDNPVKTYWLAQKMFKLMKDERGIGRGEHSGTRRARGVQCTRRRSQ